MRFRDSSQSIAKNLQILYIFQMKGKVIQFRRSRGNIIERHFLLNFGNESRKDAEKLIGKEVHWKSPAGKIIKGKVMAAHGNKGLVRAIFEIGLPGQALNTSVELSSTQASSNKLAKSEVEAK